MIQSADVARPVMLFLHGGPGMPEFFLNTTHPTGLEQHFTMVWWEQKGSGLCYNPDIPAQSMTLDQLIADTLAVTDYLRHRFGKDKIYLLGHSWGSFLGFQVAAAAPERYQAYIGVGQVSYQLKSEVAAYRYMLDHYRARGHAAMARTLEAAPASMTSGLSAAYLGLRDAAMHGSCDHNQRACCANVFFYGPIRFYGKPRTGQDPFLNGNRFADAGQRKLAN